MKFLIKYSLTLLVIFIFKVGVAQEQDNYTIHLITFYDNVDSAIGPGCKVDKEKFQSTIEKVAEKLGVELKLYNQGNDFTFNKMLDVYPKMNVGSNDVLIFFYSGHGFHSTKQDKSNKYPFMYFTDGENHKYNLLRVHEGLITKKARLTITFGDLCNIVHEGPKDDVISFGEGNNSLKNYIKLFSKAKGDFIGSSSDMGEASYVRIDNKEGSYFTFNFLTALNYILDHPESAEDSKVTWDFILNYAKEKTIEQTEKGYKEGAYKNVQHPIYNINVTY